MRLPRQAQQTAVTVALLLVAQAVAGQTTTATIEGTVTDPTGGALGGVSIEVRGAAAVRTVTTNERGAYRVAALPPGTYTVTATLRGFQTTKLEGLPLLIDRTLTADITMEIAGQAEAVVVRAAPPLIDFTTSAVGQVIESRTIESMPLNGRNYLDLMQLTPGAVVNETAPSVLGDLDTRGSLFGERAGNAAFLIDGLENNDDFRGGVLQAYTQDAIQEFEIIDAGYKAEFGGGSGGIVNVITKSGTNDLGGSAFFFTRNDALDASNVDGEEAPDLARYNSGFTLGGPVPRDRAWYFGAVEQIFERRESLFPPDIPAVLEEGEDFSRRPETESYRLFGKYTRRLNDRHELTGHASWSRQEDRHEPSSAVSLPSASNDTLTDAFIGSVVLTSTLGRRWLLDSAVAYRRQHFGRNEGLGEGFAYGVSIRDEGTSFAFGPRYDDRREVDQGYLTVRETASLLTDRHTAKLGIELTRTAADGESGQGFSSVIVTTRANFERFGPESFQIPQGPGFLEPEDARMRLRNTGVSLFAQDDWRLHPRLTLNVGARYDVDSKFDDGDNVAPRLGVVWNPDDRTAVRASWGLFYDRYRLGLAQSVPELGGMDSRTVVEINYPRLVADALPLPGSLGLLSILAGDPFVLHGLFDIPADAVVTRGSVEEITGLTPDEFLAELNRFLAGFPIPFTPVDFSPFTGFLRQDLSAGFQEAVRVAEPFKTPFNRTVTVGLQRSLPAGWVAGATYAHRDIRNVLGIRISNLAFESREVGTPITTDGGPLQRSYGPWYDGEYDALVLTIDKRFGGRYQLQASYTYARATDNLLNPTLPIGLGAQGAGAVPTDNLDLDFDRGRSDLAVPHTVVASGIAALPFDVWVSGILRATSGSYFSASGTPIDYDGDGITSPRPRGTERNEFRGPATHNADVRVEKRLRLGGRSTMSVLVELFNLTNARNPRLINSGYVDGSPGPEFGMVRVPLPGREAQIGIRFAF